MRTTTETRRHREQKENFFLFENLKHDEILYHLFLRAKKSSSVPQCLCGYIRLMNFS
jgi:hypothetical protein